MYSKDQHALVKGTSTPPSTHVSEPASILIFLLGIMALAFRRFTKGKTISAG